jgi:type IV pilus assembly protein PilX
MTRLWIEDDKIMSIFHPTKPACGSSQWRAEKGASLIIVLLILMVVSVLGLGAAQIALMGERSSRNERDQQIAWQAAEAAMIDAELDIFLKSPVGTRKEIFDGKNSKDFVDGCGTSGNSKGLCAFNASAEKPAWLTVDFTNTDEDAPTVPFGHFTGRSFASGELGIQPALPPRYLVELLPDPGRTDLTKVTYVYRVTAVGFGPRADTQAVLQMLYRN